MDGLNTGKLRVGRAGTFEDDRQRLLVGGQEGQHDVYLSSAEGLLPVCGRALPGVTDELGACRHALPKLRREGVQGGRWDPERFESPVCQSGVEERGQLRLPPVGGGVDQIGQTPHQLTPGAGVVHTQQDVRADIR
ncbi:hypothetical protein ACQ4WX_38425 [Streptomyces lasalocidi]